MNGNKQKQQVGVKMDIDGDVGIEYLRELFSAYLFRELKTHQDRLQRGLVFKGFTGESSIIVVHRVTCRYHKHAKDPWEVYDGGGEDYLDVYGCKVCHTDELLDQFEQGLYILGQDPSNSKQEHALDRKVSTERVALASAKADNRRKLRSSLSQRSVRRFGLPADVLAQMDAETEAEFIADLIASDKEWIAEYVKDTKPATSYW